MRQARGRQRDHQVIQPGEAGLALPHDPGLEARVPIAGHRYRPGPTRSAQSWSGARSGSSRRCGPPGRAWRNPDRHPFSPSSADSSTRLVSSLSTRPGQSGSDPRPAPDPPAGRSPPPSMHCPWPSRSRPQQQNHSLRCLLPFRSYTVVFTVRPGTRARVGNDLTRRMYAELTDARVADLQVRRNALTT
jgi:hypothetical protein